MSLNKFLKSFSEKQFPGFHNEINMFFNYRTLKFSILAPLTIKYQAFLHVTVIVNGAERVIPDNLWALLIIKGPLLPLRWYKPPIKIERSCPFPQGSPLAMLPNLIGLKMLEFEQMFIYHFFVKNCLIYKTIHYSSRLLAFPCKQK